MARSHRLALTTLALLVGCSGDHREGGPAGSLSLALSTEAGGVEYQLGNARFSLQGPLSMEFAGNDQQSMQLELPAGAYSLQLLDGYTLTDEGGGEVSAKLVSANPAPVLIREGETAQLTLRFELGPVAASGTGQLGIDLSVAPSSGGPDCEGGLRINELDYEQVGADEGEFIEIVNTLSCEAPLASVVVELVNGGDGKPYARYDLSQISSTLPGGGRLVLGDELVLGGLPSQVLRGPLNGSGLQNGPDAVRLLRGELLLDAVAYEAPFGDFATAAPADEGDEALGRCPDGFDSGASELDLRLLAKTPGAPNSCN